MRAVIQRCAQASMTAPEKTCSIGKGLMVLVGIRDTDTPEDAAYICRKILNLRVFSGEEGKPWMKSVSDL
eukprot:CAMPEP_0184643652 /NCGR_PEP_ID=MMETSP0308-20130426/485_1 /TAXON_ID=38269 /ORGANISM="Gloeochaete witrockiana, Strain SAG 46.84" /LENGTH=69 /DNA_ID=CAMNT_0027071719 /DNA_START=19 /DNA_END=224 /DNA_ORIENTATION=+